MRVQRYDTITYQMKINNLEKKLTVVMKTMLNVKPLKLKVVGLILGTMLVQEGICQQRDNLRQKGDRYENTGIPNNCDNKLYSVSVNGNLFEIEKIESKERQVRNIGTAFPFKCNALVKGTNNKLYSVKADEQARMPVYEYNPKNRQGNFSKWTLPSHNDGGWISGAVDSKGKLYFMTTTFENLVRIDVRKAEVDILWANNSAVKDWNKTNCQLGCNFYINQNDEMVVKENRGENIWYVSLGENPKILRKEKINSITEINPTNDLTEYYNEAGSLITLLLRRDGISNYSAKKNDALNLMKIDTLQNGILTDLAGCNYFIKKVEKESDEEKDELITVNTAKDETIRLKNVIFKLGESDLLPESYSELDKLVRQLKKYQTVEILLEGHTDITGDYNENIQLSLDRVNSCKKYLINKGIDSRRIQTRGLGSSKPLTRSNNEKEREINRRVEFKIIRGI
jgi:outer membrane protein OmpA-like peptidoglycan-associated protein